MCRDSSECKGFSYGEKNADGGAGLGCRLTKTVCPNDIDRYCGAAYTNTKFLGGAGKPLCLRDFDNDASCASPANYWGGKQYTKMEPTVPAGFELGACGDCDSKYYYQGAGKNRALIGLDACAKMCR